MSFLAEIKRRKIFQVAAIYAVVAWLLIQIVATIEEPLNLPDWFDTAAIVLMAIGFPITVIISWAFNVTPEGLVRDEGGNNLPQGRSRKIEYALIGLLILSMLWVLYRVEFEAREPIADSAPTTDPIAVVGSADLSRDVLPDSVAVLPFANLSPDPDNAFFAAGIHEEILNQLAKIRNVNVIARTSVLRYANDPPPVPEIAAALKVLTVMEGSVRYAGDTVRVTAQLIDGSSGAHLWTETYDGDLSDVFAFQTNIATSIAMSLEAELLPETRARLEKPLTDSPAAYALFLEAKDLTNNGRFPEAMPLLDRAIELDPEFAMAYAFRGWRNAWAVVNTIQAASSDASTLRAQQAQAIEDADRALELDANLGLAWLARAALNRFSWHWQTAMDEYARALALSPNSTTVMNGYGMFLAETGDCAEGMPLVRRQAELMPNNLVPLIVVVLAAHYCSEVEEALQAAKKGLDIAPGNPLMISTLGYAHLALGDLVAAEMYIRTYEELTPDEFGQFKPGLIYGYGLLGMRNDAVRVFKQFEAWASKNSAGAGDWVMAYLGIGDRDSAYDWLMREVEQVTSGETDTGYLSFQLVNHNVHDDPVLDEPRFRELFDQIDTIARSR